MTRLLKKILNISGPAPTRVFLYALFGVNLAIFALAALVLWLHERTEQETWDFITNYHMNVEAQSWQARSEVLLLRQRIEMAPRFEFAPADGPTGADNAETLFLEVGDRVGEIRQTVQSIETLQAQYGEPRFDEATANVTAGMERLARLAVEDAWPGNIESGAVAAAAQNLEQQLGQLARLHLLAHDDVAFADQLKGPIGLHFLMVLFVLLIAAGAAVSAIVARRFETAALAHGDTVAALNESEALFRGAFDQAAVGIALTNRDGTLARVNEKLCQFLGYTAEELIGRSFRDITHPDDLELGIDQHTKFLAGEISTLSTEKRYIRKDGKPTWANLTVSIVGDSSGAPRYFISVIQDINARKQAEEGAQRFRALFDQVSIGMILRDSSGVLVSANDSFCDMLGYEQDELIGKTFTEITHPEDRHIGAEEHRRIAAGEIDSFSMEKRYLRKDGDAVWVGSMVSTVRDETGSARHTTAIVQDITERKRAEEALATATELLQNAQRIALIGSWYVDLTTGTEQWSDQIYRNLGLEPGSCQASSRAFLDRMHPDDRKPTLAEISRAIERKRPFSIETRVIWPDGSERIMRERGEPVLGEDGTVIGLTGTTQDITEQKRAEVEAARSNRYLDLFFKHSLTSFVLMDRDFNFIRVNDAYARADDQEPAYFEGKNHFDLYPSDTRAVFEKVRDSKEPFQAFATPFEYTDCPERGVTYWDWTLAPILGDDGETELMVLSLNNVTERVRAEQRLRENEELFRGAFDQAGVGILLTEPDGRFKRANTKMCEILGYDEDELLGLTYADITHPDDMQESDDAHAELRAGKMLGAPLEKRYLRKDGTLIWARTTVSYMRDENGVHLGNVGLIEDINDRKEAEQALAKTAHSLAEAQRIGQVGSWELDLESGELEWSEANYRLLGVDPETFAPSYDALLDLLHPDDRSKLVARNEQARESGIVEPLEYRLVRPDGEIRVFDSRGEVVRDEDGNIRRLRVTVQDITDRKAAQMALQNAMERLEEAQRIAHVANWEWIPETNSSFWSQEIYRMFGLAPRPEGEPPAHEDFLEILHEDDREELDRLMTRTLKTGKPYETDFKIIRPDGEQRYVHEHGERFIDPATGHKCIRGTVQDVTELKKTQRELSRLNTELEQRVEERTAALREAQEELVKAERLATLGQLTATVSHELRNPLGAMRTSMYIIEQVADMEDTRLARSIDRINRSITRCDNIIDELLDFTRIRNLERVNIRIDDWLGGLMDEQPPKGGAKVTRKLGASNAVVSADASRLRRAIINVFENACQASADPDGCSPAGQNHNVTIETRRRKKRLEIIISDTGHGIAPNILPRIFEPLFSTKSFGVGLGLPTVKQIMEQHGGGISVTSKPGKGARFVLWLPLEPALEVVR